MYIDTQTFIHGPCKIGFPEKKNKFKIIIELIFSLDC